MPLPKLPTSDLDAKDPLQTSTEYWFTYPFRVYPHHTDYAGIVWHGCYVQWLEEARVECLRSLGISFAELVEVGCDLPVVEMSLRYHQSLTMGMEAVVKVRMFDTGGVRIRCEQKITSPDDGIIYLSGVITLVAIDRDKGKIMRRLPPAVQKVLVRNTEMD